MTKTYRSIDTLKFDPANARKHDERNIKAIMDSLRMHQQRKPVVIYSDMIVADNGTVEAAKRLGWSEVWVNNDPFESLAAAKAYALQDNRSGELAAWDDIVLGDTLTELKEAGFNLDDIGFNDNFMEKFDDWEAVDTPEPNDANSDGSVGRVVLMYEMNEYKQIINLAQKAITKNSLSDMSELFKLLLVENENR